MKARLGPAIAALALSGCVAGPPPEVATPAPVLPDSFLYAPSQAEQAALAGLLPEDDPAFAQLAQAAVEGSPTLAEALARIDQARASARRVTAERLPAVDAGANVTGQRINPVQFGGALPPGVALDTEQASYGATLTARWDADLFGRLRAQERALRLRIDAAEAGAAALRLALMAEIAGNVIDWRTVSQRAAQLQSDLEAATDLARLADVRERAGIAPGFDRVRAEAQAAASRSRLAALESERVRLVGQLVTLTAQNAGAVRAALASGPIERDLPAPPASAPSLLLVNRPDILEAAAQLAASDAELAATARQRFPSLGLSATVGLLAFGIGDLFSESSLIGTLAASIAGPLVDFGRIQAEIDGAAASKQIAFQRYRSAVYRALGEAEAGYGLVLAADQEAAAAAAQRDSAQRAARLADARYRAGLADFLTVLEARRTADASGDQAAAAAGRARRARVVLWQALGGAPTPMEAAPVVAPGP